MDEEINAILNEICFFKNILVLSPFKKGKIITFLQFSEWVYPLANIIYIYIKLMFSFLNIFHIPNTLQEQCLDEIIYILTCNPRMLNIVNCIRCKLKYHVELIVPKWYLCITGTHGHPASKSKSRTFLSHTAWELFVIKIGPHMVLVSLNDQHLKLLLHTVYIYGNVNPHMQTKIVWFYNK